MPVATLLLVLLLSSWLLHEAEPLSTPPPEQRKETGVNPDLSPQEAAIAHAVIEPGFASRGGREQLLFIGNSQTMAIPYAKPWDISTPQWFQVLMSRRYPEAVDVHRGSLGGLTMVETLVRVVNFGESVQRPATVVIAVHPELINRLSMRDEVRDEALHPSVAGRLHELGSSGSQFTSAAHVLTTFTYPAQAPQTTKKEPWPTRLESSMQTEIEALNLLAQREAILDLANVTFRKYRNRVFHVTSASPRPLENGTYLTNLNFLAMTLQYTRERGIKTILYFGPVRSIQPNPDSAADLGRIHRDVTAIASSHGAELLDYSNLVPEAYWTAYEPVRLNQLTGDAGQSDFAHFRAEGHRLVAEQLARDVGAEIAKPTQ